MCKFKTKESSKSKDFSVDHANGFNLPVFVEDSDKECGPC